MWKGDQFAIDGSPIEGRERERKDRHRQHGLALNDDASRNTTWSNKSNKLSMSMCLCVCVVHLIVVAHAFTACIVSDVVKIVDQKNKNESTNAQMEL